MQAAKSKRVILFAAIAVLLVAAGVGAGYLLGKARSGDEKSSGAEKSASRESTATDATGSSAEATVPAPSDQTATSTAGQDGGTAKNADDGRKFAFIKKLYLKDGQVWATVDFLQLFTGAQADTEAAKHGQEAPNGYYVLNDNPKLREFAVRNDATIVTSFGGDPAEKATPKPQELYDWSINEDGLLDYRLFWVTIVNGEVTAIEHMWVP